MAEPRTEFWWPSHALSFGGGSGPEEALHLVMGYMDDPRDWEATSLVCRRWHRTFIRHV